jgi:hypothetical protein
MMPATGEIYGIFPAKELISLRAIREVSTAPIARSAGPPIGRDGGGSRLRGAGERTLISLWRREMEVILTDLLIVCGGMKEVANSFSERNLFG